METVLLVMLLIALGPGAQAGSLYTLETEILKENSVEFKNPVIPEGYDCAESIGGPEGIDTRSLCENPEGVIVQTKYGPVRGSVETVDDKTINIFKGIPFAAPPERFQKPKPPKSWTDVLDTTKFGAFCLQMGFGSEDCLFLNVWSPQSKGKNLPVMVWIYGGAFITGSSSSNWYKRAQVAARGDVVVVSFNYRVGPLGFLSTGDANAPGNYGLWDQHEAITWVSRNIKAFGGDPNSITLFGESAGAASVNFQTAKHFCCPTNDTKTMINCLRKVNGRRLSLIMRLKKLIPIIQAVVWAPVIDGDFLPRDPEIRHSNAADVDYIAGVNNWDGFIFAKIDLYYFSRVTRKRFYNLIESIFPDKDKKAIDSVYEIYSQANGNLTTRKEIKQATIDFETDIIFLVSTQTTLNLHQKNAKNANTYSYVFSYAKKNKGADHADELPYVFGIPFETKRYYSRTDRKISEYMIGYWTNFAHTGNPNKGSSAVPDLWQPYTISDAYYLEINNPLNKASVKQHLRKDFVKFWVDVFPKL